ncbi:MAG: SHOCT domain-containing protein [Nitrososphaeria archaeon]
MGEKGELFGALFWLIIGAVVLFVLGYVAKSFFFSTLAMVFVGLVIVIGGFIFIAILFLVSLGSAIATVEKRDVKGGLMLLLLIGICVFGYYSTAYLDHIANSPEVPEAEVGSTIYTGLEGHPVAKTILSTIFGSSLAEYLNDLIPSGYHWTVFRVTLPNYVNYLCIAEGDFEGTNFYRIQIEDIYEFGIFTILKLNKIEEINVFEAAAYIFGHALPFGTLIFKIQSYAFLIAVPVLLVGAIRCLAAKPEERLEKKPEYKLTQGMTHAEKERAKVSSTLTVFTKPVEASEVKRELEELKTRYDVGEISSQEFNKKKMQLKKILETRQEHLLTQLRTTRRQKEELEARRLVGELSREDYEKKMRSIQNKLENIKKELALMKKLEV